MTENMDFGGEVEQRVEFHLVNGSVWSTTIGIYELTELLEAYRDKDYVSIRVTASNPDRQWYIRIDNIVGIEVTNSEDVREGRRVGATPDKSRRAPTQRVNSLRWSGNG